MPTIQGIFDRWKTMTGPAPLNDFENYDDYWESRGKLNRIYGRWIIATRFIEPGATILDVGCGSGEFLQYLREQKPEVKASGIDFSAKAVQLTREAGFEAEVVDLLSEKPPDVYDYVTCLEVIEHIPDAEAFMKNLKKAFRKQLIISIPNIGYLGCRLRLGFFGRFPTTNCVMHIKEHVRHWTHKDFKQWTEHLGLTLVHGEGHRGTFGTPWRRWPSLFAQGTVYVLEHADAK